MSKVPESGLAAAELVFERRDRSHDIAADAGKLSNRKYDRHYNGRLQNGFGRGKETFKEAHKSVFLLHRHNELLKNYGYLERCPVDL